MRQVFAFLALAILAFTALMGFQAAMINAGENTTVVNETFTNDSAGQITADVITLEDSNIDGAFYGDDDTVTVYNNSDIEMDEGTDYEWLEKNGTIEVLSGGDLVGDTNGTISYQYQLTTQEQRDMARLLSALPQILGFALPILAFLALVVIARG